MDATEEALAELQARVQRLEARLGGDEPQEQPAAAGTGGGTFWLLDALRERGLAGGAPVSWQTARLAEDLTLVAGGWLRVTTRPSAPGAARAAGPAPRGAGRDGRALSGAAPGL